MLFNYTKIKGKFGVPKIELSSKLTLINRKEKCGPQCFSSIWLGHSKHDFAILKPFTYTTTGGEGEQEDLTQGSNLFPSSALYSSVKWIYDTTDVNYQTKWKVKENPSLNLLTFYLVVVITHLFTIANIQSNEPVFCNAIGRVFHRTFCIKVKFTFHS